jgi:hypothetical protein
MLQGATAVRVANIITPLVVKKIPTAQGAKKGPHANARRPFLETLPFFGGYGL